MRCTGRRGIEKARTPEALLLELKPLALMHSEPGALIN